MSFPMNQATGLPPYPQGYGVNPQQQQSFQQAQQLPPAFGTIPNGFQQQQAMPPQGMIMRSGQERVARNAAIAEQIQALENEPLPQGGQHAIGCGYYFGCNSDCCGGCV